MMDRDTPPLTWSQRIALTVAAALLLTMCAVALLVLVG